jgi:hypothetical protein
MGFLSSSAQLSSRRQLSDKSYLDVTKHKKISESSIPLASCV